MGLLLFMGINKHDLTTRSSVLLITKQRRSSERRSHGIENEESRRRKESSTWWPINYDLLLLEDSFLINISSNAFILRTQSSHCSYYSFIRMGPLKDRVSLVR